LKKKRKGFIIIQRGSNDEFKEEYTKMQLTVDEVYNEAMQLPNDSKASLAERLVEYLETHTDHDLERLHLDIAKRRRDEIRSGQVQPIDGDHALAHVRRLIKK
jgi:hypothetical protein